MKKPNKIVLSSLIALVGFTVASSVTSTVAWFQYATRASVAYTGTSAHCSKLLNISVDGGTNWGTDIRSDSLPTAKFAPITTGEIGKDDALPTQTVVTEYEDDGITPKTTVTKSRFYASPDYRQGLYSNWLIAEDDNYLQFEVLIRLADVDENYGTASQKYLANDVYLTDLTIQNSGTNDLAESVRVHIASTYYDGGVEQNKNFLFAKTVESTEVGGFLDVNDDGLQDTGAYEWDDTLCLYGGSVGAPVTSDVLDDHDNVIGQKLENPLLQTSYSATEDPNPIIAEDNNGVITGGTSIGKTSTSVSEYMKVVVTVWLEGWSELHRGNDGNYQDEDSSIWNSASYAAKKFNVGMTFGVQLHADNEQSSLKGDLNYEY